MTKEEIMVLDNEVQKILKKHEDDNGCYILMMYMMS